MRFILTLFNILFTSLLSVAYQSNYVQVIGSLSTLKTSLSIDGNLSIYLLDISLRMEYDDYGEIKDYELLNSEYYIETSSYRIYETLISTKVGINLGNFRGFARLKGSFVNAITQSVVLYYGVGGSLSFSEGITLGFDLDDFNLSSGNLTILGYVSYSDTSFIENIRLSLSKGIVSTLGFEFLSEVRLLKFEYLGVNVSLGYKGSFGGRQLYPYLTTLKLILPYGFEIFNITKFSEFAYDTSVGITYKFSFLSSNR